MNNKLKKAMTITVLTALAFSIPVIIFQTRAPVLIVAEESFFNLYGAERVRREAFYSSLVLFRNVKTVSVVNDAAEDIISLAVKEISAQPYCVLFPLRFAGSAAIYHEQNPDIRVILMEGRNIENGYLPALSDGKTVNFFKYKTDIKSDFYRAGSLAAVFELPEDQESEESSSINENNVKKRTVAVFLEYNLNNFSGTMIKEAFLMGINEHKNPPEVKFYTSYADYSKISDISCVVLAGSGSEFLENKDKAGIPVIIFTWLDPSFLTSLTAVAVDDSPWAQVVQTVKMADSGEKDGLLKSRFIVTKRKKNDKILLRRINETK